MKFRLSPFSRCRFTVVDEQDLPLLRKYKWFLSTHGYVVANVPGSYPNRRQISMHRLLMGATSKQAIDHINGDKRDNRRRNLRFANKSQNAANKSYRQSVSGYKGVYPYKGKWIVKITKDCKQRHIAYCKTKEEAARTYDKVALELFGEFARLNFPRAASPAANQF